MNTNTLSITYTSNFFESEEDYRQFCQKWSEMMNSDKKNDLKAVHHLLCLALRGKDWRKAFTLPTNRNKLENGYQPAVLKAFQTLNSSYREDVVLDRFDGLVTKPMLAAVRRVIATPVIENGKMVSPAYNVEGE